MDLLKMAQDAGFDVHPRKGQIRSPFDFCANDITGIVEKFAHAVAAAERKACYDAIEAIDDGEAPEYRACQEAVMDRSNGRNSGAAEGGPLE